jgi:hypothetical protein
MGAGPQNLTDVWQGLFSYPRRYRAASFTATLIESIAGLTGSTTEIAVGGPRDGVAVSAFLSGRRTGRRVIFTKQYEGPEEPNHSIEYEGSISDDFLEIDGRWFIPGSWAGRFLMIRSGGRSVETMREAFEKA